MPELFTLEELVTISQVPSLPMDIAQLARELVTIEVRNAIGATLYDSLTDLSPFRGIALAAAKRGIRNPEGLRSSSEEIDDYKYTNTYASETLTEIELTEDEIARLRKRAGIHDKAFSIAPAVPTPAVCCVSPYGCTVCKPVSCYSYPAAC